MTNFIFLCPLFLSVGHSLVCVDEVGGELFPHCEQLGVEQSGTSVVQIYQISAVESEEGSVPDHTINPCPPWMIRRWTWSRAPNCVLPYEEGMSKKNTSKMSIDYMLLLRGAVSVILAWILFWVFSRSKEEPSRVSVLWIASSSTAFLWGIDSGILSYFPTIAPSIGLSSGALGAVFAAGYFGPVLAGSVTNKLIPFLGRPGVMMVSTLSCVGASVCFGFVPRLLGRTEFANLAADVVLRAVIGTAALTYQAVLFSFLNDLYGEEMTYASSIVFLWVCTCALWPGLCGQVYLYLGFEAANWTPAFLCLVACAPSLGLVSRIRERCDTVEETASNRSPVMWNKSIAKTLMAMTIPVVIWGYVVSTMEIELELVLGPSSQSAVTEAGILIGIFTGTIAVLSPIVGMAGQAGYLGSRRTMHLYGSVMTAASLIWLLLPEFWGLQNQSLIFVVFAFACVSISISTRFVMVPGPKIVADVTVANGGLADVGFFLFQMAYSLGCGIGAMAGPILVQTLGYRNSTLVIAGLCLTGPLLLRGVCGVDPELDVKDK